MDIRYLIALILSSSVAWACWLDIPLDRFVADSPLVIQGRIVKIDSAPRQEYAEDIAYIEVTEVLKSDSNKKISRGDQIKLLMPALNNEMIVSTDIRYALGTDGYWILREDSGAYKADYPKAYQDRSKMAEVANALEKSRTVKSEMKK